MSLHPEIEKLRERKQVFAGSDTGSYCLPTKGHCHICNRNTPTLYIMFRTGHIGNCCQICRTCRKGRPYVTNHEYEQHLNALIRQEVHAHDPALR